MPFGGLLTAGAIGAGGSIASSLFGKSSAKSAAKTQTDAANAAGQQVVDAANAANPQIGAAADKASTNVLSAADKAATGVTTAADQAATGATTAAGNANTLLDPYSTMGAGAANALTVGMSDFNKTPTMADLEIDPGFAFRLEQGQKALTAKAAASGGAFGGGALKALARYSQGVASDEYGKAFQRYEDSTAARFGRMNTLATEGQAAAGTQGANLLNSSEYAGSTRLGGAENVGALGTGAAEFAGNAGMNAANLIASNTIGAAKAKGEFLTQGANATAAGQIGAANATMSGVSGATGSIANALLMSKLLGGGGSGTGTPFPGGTYQSGGAYGPGWYPGTKTP